MSPVREVRLLGGRAIREALRTPEATIPTLFIPLFFLVVNVGQVSKTFDRSTPFLHGQSYAAFQLPISIMFAVSTGMAGLALVQDIEVGYFDKLLVAPIRRTSIVLGRLAAEFVKGAIVSLLVILVSFAFGVRIASGVLGLLLIVLMAATWGVAYGALACVIALRTRNVQATNSSQILFFPLLFLTPNFVPRDRLSGWMEALATVNPVTYVIEGIRALILEGFELVPVLRCVGVIVGLTALLLFACVRAMQATGKS